MQLRMVKKQKQDYLSWWKKWFNIVRGHENEANQLYAISGMAYETSGLWSVSKLIILSYYLPAYLQIVNKHFKKIYYIDGCAACGLVKINKRLFLGSSLLAERATSIHGNRKFDKIYSIDIDLKNTDVLNKIVDPERTTVINGDVNEVLPRILEKLDKDPLSHFVCFVDPEGTEVNWSTMKRLLESKGDVIYNYMCSGVARNINALQSVDRLNMFFGSEDWTKYRDLPEKSENLFNLYLNNIRNLRKTTVDVKVNSDLAFHYHLIFAFRKSGWEHILNDVKEKIESITPEDLEELLCIYEGKQKTLF
ncbi:MAG: three-Cys-motif partner protein TcmP [Candidatus Bathyarchaeia archaeon]